MSICRQKKDHTLQETNISPKNGILKMIFLFPRWDMLIPWRVSINRVTLNFCSASGRQVISSLRSWLDRKLTASTTSTAGHNSNTLRGHKTFLCSSQNSWESLKNGSNHYQWMLHWYSCHIPANVRDLTFVSCENNFLFGGSNLPKSRNYIGSSSRFLFVIVLPEPT